MNHPYRTPLEPARDSNEPQIIDGRRHPAAFARLLAEQRREAERQQEAKAAAELLERQGITVSPEQARRNASNATVTTGLALIALGIVVTAITYGAAAGGGTFIIPTGAIGVGIARVIRGLLARP